MKSNKIDWNHVRRRRGRPYHQDYSDWDWAGDHATRKSISGFIFMFNDGPVSWCSKCQATVALSSKEAEYVALTLAAKEATWLRLLLTELGLLPPAEQYAEIKIAEGSAGAAETKANLRDQEEERQDFLSKAYPNNTTAPSTDVTEHSISLKGDN